MTRYVKDKYIAERYAVTRPTVWDWVKANSGFPKPVKLSERCTRWRLDEIEAWEAAKAEAA